MVEDLTFPTKLQGFMFRISVVALVILRFRKVFLRPSVAYFQWLSGPFPGDGIRGFQPPAVAVFLATSQLFAFSNPAKSVCVSFSQLRRDFPAGLLITRFPSRIHFEIPFPKILTKCRAHYNPSVRTTVIKSTFFIN
jgi:hypothetical protein